MGFFEEFKQFAIKGNVIDLAVGVIIGGAFGKITNSLVTDIFMPPLGLLISGLDFRQIKIPLKAAVTDPASGKVLHEAVSIQVGNLIQVCFEFTLMAFAIFLLVRFLNHVRTLAETTPPPSEPAPPPPDIALLTEIRDLLKDNRTA